ncbi:hypothetical protein CQW23_31235 [Capsicum baccatum]|uniref:Uncharacterized protein n=1 Tax=Capsicum baccatum TaxID=33114 RepID=A0A2G2V869_CAPBA|nr:hypothetical protein CQW23_31235 [Capsicum baccatum]
MASGATSIQRLDGSRDSAIHTKYRISLRSSSMREPRYRLPSVVFIYRKSTGPPDAHRGWGTRGTVSIHVFLGALRVGFRWSPAARAPGTGGGAHTRYRSTPPTRTLLLLNTFARSFCGAGFDNDPSAANRPRHRDPNISPDHSICRSKGRQIASPPKNGHAPPPIESRKSSQSVNPYYVWTCTGNRLQAILHCTCPAIEMAGGSGRRCSSRDPTYRTFRSQLMCRASKCSVDARPASALTAAIDAMRCCLCRRCKAEASPSCHDSPPLGGAEEMKARRGSCTGAAHDGRRQSSADWALPHVCSAWSLP